MVAQRIDVGLVTVEQDVPFLVDDRHTQALHAVLLHIVAEEMGIQQVFLTEGLHHLVVVHLKSSVEDVDLIVLFALVLIYAETDGEKQEDAADAEQQIALERLTSQKYSHSLHVS